MPITHRDTDEAAALLIRAARTRGWLERLPEAFRPAAVDDALAIQAAIVARAGERIAGWKVGGVVEGAITYGVLLESRVQRSPARIASADMPLLGMEAEVAFRFLHDLPPRAAEYSQADVEAAVVAFPAIEVVATRYTSYQGTPFIERLADCMSNGAFVVGPDQPSWRTQDLEQLEATLTFDEQIVTQRRGGHAAGHPLRPAVTLVNALRTSSGVRAGQMMTTGTYTGLNYAQPGQRVRASFDAFGAAELVID